MGDGSWLRLTPDAIVLYKYAVTNPDWTDGDIPDIGLAGEKLAGAIAVLYSIRLFRRSVFPGRVWDAVGPKCALVDLMTDEEARLRQAQLTMLRTQDELLNLVPSYFDALRERCLSEPIDVIDCNLTISRLLAELTRPAVSEICVASPGSRAEDIKWLHDLGSALAERPEIGARFLLDHSTQSNQQVRRQLARLNEAGRNIRTMSSVPLAAVLVDRCAVFMRTSGGRRHRDVAVVKHPTVMASYRNAFERLWSMATPYSPDDAAGRRVIRDQQRMGILRHLAAGEKDEVIARRLGLSVRTCRRYIADIMTDLGATGRFQAGVLAQRRLFDELGTADGTDLPDSGSSSAG